MGYGGQDGGSPLRFDKTAAADSIDVSALDRYLEAA
jgi:hypothetical protein